MKEIASPELNITTPADLPYEYYDLFNLFVGPEEVVIELGNIHRSLPGQATIRTRAVLSVSNAFRLAQSLQQTLTAMQERLRQEMAGQEGSKSH